MKSIKKIVIASACTAIIGSAFTSCKKTESSFTINKSTVWVGEPVSVTDGVKDGTKNLSYSYNFGDENSLVSYVYSYGDRNPSHVYNKAGQYVITQQISKSRNYQKSSGKSYHSSQNIQVITVSPSMSLSINSSSIHANQNVLITNTTDESGNLGSAVNYNFAITGPNGTSNYGSSEVVSWTPSTGGNYQITLTSTQGNSVVKTTKSVNVIGQASNTSTYLYNGTWNLNVSASLSGTTYTGTCTAPIYNNAYSTVIMSNGNVYAGVTANTGTTNANAGNVVSLSVYFSFMDETLVNINNASNLFNNASIVPSGFPNTTPNGLYKITSATDSQIVLTKKISGTGNAGCGSGTYTDIYVITLTK